MSRIAGWLPEPDVTTRHAIDVAAPRTTVYRTLVTTDFGSHPVVAVLMALRSVPAFVTKPRETYARLRRRGGTTRLPLKALLGEDFTLLEEQPDEEIVLGLTGRFWTASGGLIASDPTTFRAAVPAGLARAAWSFELVALDDRRTRLSTETRVRCADPVTRRSFLRYWRVIAPASGLIRRAILSMVRRRAEAAATA